MDVRFGYTGIIMIIRKNIDVDEHEKPFNITPRHKLIIRNSVLLLFYISIYQ
jgi:hypothetical protein